MADGSSKDLPFRVEYAKSNRASCKSCRNKIDKESLRLAKMVQSPVFDGKIPNWFHYHCFFKKNKPESQADIGGFPSLRWDDQQRIKETLSGKETGGALKSADPDAEVDTITTLAQFIVGYASSGRAQCHGSGCSEKIAMKTVRIALLKPMEEHLDYGPTPCWYHVDCFVNAKHKENDYTEWPANGKASMLTDFNLLKDTDKKMLEEKFKKAMPKTKGQGKGKTDPPPAKKAAPKISKLDRDLKTQNDQLWAIRDQLYRWVKNNGLKDILEANDQLVPPGESRLLDSVADGMMFGALEKCPECENGQLVVSSSGLSFKCTGNLTSWTKCQYRSKDVPRSKTWHIPEYLKEDIDYLKNFKFVAYNKGKRLFPEEEEGASTSAASQDGAGDGKRKIVKKPEDKALYNCTIVLHGKLSKSNKQLKTTIQDLGGEVATKITPETACVISNEAEVKKMNKKMKEAESNDVHVVSEDFLDAVKNGGAALMITQHSISTWGSDPTTRIADTVAGQLPTKSIGQLQREKDESKFTSVMPKTSKMQLKGGAVVEDQNLGHATHVHKEKGVLYSATLGLVDISRGTNSYYKLQLIKHDSQAKYWVYRSWGRVGTTIGGSKSEHYGSDLAGAKEMFKNTYLEKTGNKFGAKNPIKHPMKFFPLDISYDEEEERITSSKERAGKTSQLPKQIQSLMKMIFDLEELKKTMLEFEIDLEKMPLGKLSKKQIEDAYRVLTDLQKLLTDKAPRSGILDASNQFYTLIPHNFGLKSIPLLDSLDIIQAKTQMLDSLLDIEIAYSMLKETGEAGVDPIDVHYQKLKCPMEVVDKKSDEFKLIKEYTDNTHAATHNWYRLSVEEVFRINRDGEGTRFKPFKKLHNRQLLWHGSRKTNFGGILSQGLRIAPPEAPATGYMFGKGLYFADMVTKSANYCYANASSNIGLMILSDVALGDMYELYGAKGMSKPPAGKHSTKGLGRTCPDPSGLVTIEDNLQVPMGKGCDSNINNTSLLYNEYIVYDVAQVQMRYLIKMKFNYNC
ncbi:poly [ADP-ribose] polymerase 1 [Strongylocentrotus purpuratus]|uniref:Poly [ADP-ribose] polymerase n=1 Tax=Strongylocentrotus purpuratus TaxID=7668 RepID=A0A7M7PTF6_STRPU|nr:poly [ADP-ribose] polymerase 1 [Strongylocentrotus purpuratus]